MNPDAVYDSETEHDHEHKRTAVTDQRQRHAGNRQDGNRHPDVLENVCKNQRADSDYEQSAKLISGAISHE